MCVYDKEWCMCGTVDIVRNDEQSTCDKCCGADAWGKSPNRQKDKRKVLRGISFVKPYA